MANSETAPAAYAFSFNLPGAVVLLIGPDQQSESYLTLNSESFKAATKKQWVEGQTTSSSSPKTMSKRRRTISPSPTGEAYQHRRSSPCPERALASGTC
jgi:hypothetical protein